MWRKLYFQNERFERGVQQALRSGLVKVSPYEGMIVLRDDAQAMDANSNWLFFGHTTALRDCYLWHSIMFNCFQLVPDFCRLRCYKVVVKVRNFLEAMQFYNTMLAGPTLAGDLMPIHGKVGIDEREYSSGHFNGFIYCDGLQDALEKYRHVRALVDANIPTGKDIPIIVKKTCTEFERKYGATDSDFWQSTPEEDRDLQNHIEDVFQTYMNSVAQPDWLKNKVITKMVRWANTVGDKTWLEFFDCPDFLTMQAVTYHHLAIEHKPQPQAKVDPGTKRKQKRRK